MTIQVQLIGTDKCHVCDLSSMRCSRCHSQTGSSRCRFDSGSRLRAPEEAALRHQGDRIGSVDGSSTAYTLITAEFFSALKATIGQKARAPSDGKSRST